MDEEVETPMRQFRHKVIKKFNIFVIYFLDGPEPKIFVNTPEMCHMKSVLNSNFILIIVGEMCMVVPVLCAKRWKYFETIIERYQSNNVNINGALVIDITSLVIDSKILDDVKYSGFGYYFLRFLYENNGYNLFLERSDRNTWRKLLDLLIPPINYWTQRTDVFGNAFGDDYTRTTTSPITYDYT